MIFLNGVKWKHSLKRLIKEHSPGSDTPKEDKAHMRRMIKAYGTVWCWTDPFEEEINGCKVLLWARSEDALDQLVRAANQEI